jgi:hypothetical protein
MTHLVVWGGEGGRGGAGWGGRGQPAALSVGQLLSLCTALSFLLPWRLSGGLSLNRPIVRRGELTRGCVILLNPPHGRIK